MLATSARPAGSSPRIRGESRIPYGDVTIRRIIPANTGRMYLWLAVSPPLRDHPREYGENGFYFLWVVPQ